MTPFQNEIARFVVKTLMLTDVSAEAIEVDAPLVDAYGLDSIDFLELAMAIHKSYGVEFADKDERNATYFRSVASLAAHVEANRPRTAPAPPVDSLDERAYREIVGGLREMFDFPEESLHRDALLVDDLGLDSLDSLDLVVRLQDTLGARIPDDRLKDLKTIGDVVAITVELTQSTQSV